MRPLQLTAMLTATLASGLAAHAYGMDHPSFTDLRLEASILPDKFDTDATASGPLGSVSRSGDTEFDDSWRVGIIALSARGTNDGIIAFGSGGGIQYSRWESSDDVDQTVEALAATLRLGVVIRPTEMFHIEAMPYGAIGAARGEIGDEDSDPSLYWEVGGIVGAFLTFNNFQVGLHGGYLWNGTDLDFDGDDNFTDPVDDVEVELRGDGAFFGLSVGARF